jgi:hypothetical protein
MLRRLGREYGHDRLETACAQAQFIRAPHYKLHYLHAKCDRDLRAIDAPIPTQASLPRHENVHDPDCYH